MSFIRTLIASLLCLLYFTTSAQELDPVLERNGQRCDYEHVVYETFLLYLGEGLREDQVIGDLQKANSKDKVIDQTERDLRKDSIKHALTRFKRQDRIQSLSIDDRRAVVVFECLARTYRSQVK